ncbi:glutamate-cysteine ligase family protein [Amycolatopsis jejuensis]|uniref:glutamate-cysteine ligase family protein n=1 Tax=Amycolatopsis jejuensis TaxID=330084 RepID=UPI00052758F4|nr:glutamate-cysteine ligase family protein [Amycolatopsis jejuensis]
MADAPVCDVVQQMFRPGPGLGVGVEVEMIPSFADGSPVPPAVLDAVFDLPFRTAARPSFEPGGQLELSPPPQESVTKLLAELDRILARARELAASAGVGLAACGTDPGRSCADVPLRLCTDRYLAMQHDFDRSGADGRRMMRLTASLQVAVDLQPGAAGREQWLVANLAGPALAAAFANSPHLDGLPAATPGTRTRIWQGIDAARTGYDGRHLDPDDPVGAYTAFAAAAPRLPIPPAAAGAYHLGTLFPPVRPRGGYLEVRYLDAQPPGRIAAAVTAVAVLLLEPVTRRAAVDLLLPNLGRMSGQWTLAAQGNVPETGPLLDLIAAGKRRMPRGFLPDRLTTTNRETP